MFPCWPGSDDALLQLSRKGTNSRTILLLKYKGGTADNGHRTTRLVDYPFVSGEWTTVLGSAPTPSLKMTCIIYFWSTDVYARATRTAFPRPLSPL